MTASTLPDPLTTKDIDVRDLDGFMLNSERLLASELMALSTGDEFKAAVRLWCRAWKQIPAASLPNDPRVLASFAGIPDRRWPKVRDMVLRGFVLCSDGRLYHKTLAEDARRAFGKKVEHRNKTLNATEARRRMRDGQRDDGRNDNRNDNRKVNVATSQGQGQGQGQGQESSTSPPSPVVSPREPEGTATASDGAKAPPMEKPLSKRAKGFSEVALRLATNSGDIPAILACFGVTPGHEDEFRRETDGMQVGEIVAVLAWRRYLKDPVRFPSGFRIGRTLWRDLGIDTRRELAESLLGSMGIEVDLKPAVAP